MSKKLKKRHTMPEDLIEPLTKVLGWIQESTAENTAVKLLEALPDFKARDERNTNKLESIKKQLSVLTARNELLENANETNRLLGSQFYDERVVMPMARSLFPVMDLIMTATEKLNADSPRYQLALQYVSALQTQLEQFLSDYGIESFINEDENLDPKTMKPMKVVLTNDHNCEGLVEETLQCGFRMEERVLRLASVSLYKYESALKR